jgi:hypothetical protein
MVRWTEELRNAVELTESAKVRLGSRTCLEVERAQLLKWLDHLRTYRRERMSRILSERHLLTVCFEQYGCGRGDRDIACVRPQEFGGDEPQGTG